MINHRPRGASLLVWQLRLVSVALAVAACGGSQAASIGFGTGGLDCELEGTASTFPAGTTVRVVARFDPAPGTVIVKATKDGSPLHDPETITLDGTLPCVYGELPNVEAGSYEYVLTIPDSKTPPLTGRFEVTPDDR